MLRSIVHKFSLQILIVTSFLMAAEPAIADEKIFVPMDTQSECDLKKLAEKACSYATTVKTCLHPKLAEMTEDEIALMNEWFKDRGVRKEQCTLIIDQGGDVDEYCKAVYGEILAPVIAGKNSCQFGNCGEAMHVNYCQIHYSGCADESYHCKSENDHRFTIFKTEDGLTCILDRYNNLEPTAGGHNSGTHGLPMECGGTMWCDDHLQIKDNTVCWGDPLTCSRKPWYQDVTCNDPFGTSTLPPSPPPSGC